MKTRKPTQANSARKTSGAIIAKHYLDLQKLRDEVRKAESINQLINIPTLSGISERRFLEE
jgi:hypothetical protein